MGSPGLAAAHIGFMTTATPGSRHSTPRLEARDPDTPAGRLRELSMLGGDRGAHDSDSGWCREFVAANPSAPADVLEELGTDENDVMCRRNVAANPSAPKALLQRLAEDGDRITADAARHQLGLIPRGGEGIRIAGGYRLDPRTGRITR